MGVMSCSRKDCKLEFRAYLQKKGLNLKTEDQVRKKIEKFLTVSKNTQ